MSAYFPVRVDPEHLTQFCHLPDLPSLNSDDVSQRRADAHWMVLDKADVGVARCSLWWRQTPPYEDHKLGFMGHYAAHHPEASLQLLAHVSQELTRQGCTMAVGPINGDTWHSYRWVIDQGSEPYFFLEPHQPQAWVKHFTDNGFTPLATYYSTLKQNLEPSNSLSHIAHRAEKHGIQIRPFQTDRFEAELKRLYGLALLSFKDNFLYTPISQADFLALYRPLQPYLQSEIVLIAERDDQPLGFIFALPDFLQAQRGEPIDTIILKTVAVHPDHRARGLGSLLVAQCQTIAYQSGYRRAIHALMYEKNQSRKISRRHHTETIRRYALFAKPLSRNIR